MKRFSSLCCAAVLSLVLLSGGCAVFSTPPPSPEEGRYNDAEIKTDIVSTLLKKDPAKANDISVHSFDGHIFLVGEGDSEFREQAYSVARKTANVVHVTTHWFPFGTADPLRDAPIEAEIEATVLHSEKMNGRRAAVDAWGGHVVLTGIVATPQESSRIVENSKKVPHVKSVTSYLSVRP